MDEHPTQPPAAGTGDVDENGDLIEALSAALRARVDAARLVIAANGRNLDDRRQAVDRAFVAADQLIAAVGDPRRP